MSEKEELTLDQFTKYIVNHFAEIYYNVAAKNGCQVWFDTYWLGTPTQKLPLDLWVYQEIFYNLKPDVIIECGTAAGGSSLFMATVCDAIGNGKIITIDIIDECKVNHPRITKLIGSSISQEIIEKVKSLIDIQNEKIIVILDSDHHKEHVLNELNIYSKFVSKGSYLIVEDTNINGHPVFPEFGPGPMEAVDEFIENNYDFSIDRTWEKFYITQNPKGFLLKGEVADYNLVNKCYLGEQKYSINASYQWLKAKQFEIQAKDAQIDELSNSLQAKDAQIDELSNSLQAKDAQIDELSNSLQVKEMQLQQIQRGIVMQLLSRYHRVLDRLLRSGTRPRYYYELGLTSIQTILNKGLKSFWHE